MSQRKRPEITSIQLSEEAKIQLDEVCKARGMTINGMLGKLIVWFNGLDQSEQSIALGQVEPSDVRALAGMVRERRQSRANRPVKAAGRSS